MNHARRRGTPGTPVRPAAGWPRRRWLGLPLAAALAGRAAPVRGGGDAVAEAAQRLHRGGLVLAFRHALAPGNGDPLGFRLDDCATQRNLSDEGRAQARRIGSRLAALGLAPARVRSSPWCRCLETARLAFGRAEAWSALGSPRAGTEASNTAALAELRQALQATTLERRPFEAWVTHGFVLAELAGGIPASGEGLVLQAGPDGATVVVARIVTT